MMHPRLSRDVDGAGSEISTTHRPKHSRTKYFANGSLPWSDLVKYFLNNTRDSQQCTFHIRPRTTQTIMPNIPLGEPPWLDGHPSPYYKPTHIAWQKFCRSFFDKHLTPYAMDWEREEMVPPSVYKTFAEANMLIPNLPAPLPVSRLRTLGINNIGPVDVQDFDYIHTAIYVAESKRCGLNGPTAALLAGFRYGLPLLLEYGSPQLQNKVLGDIFSGEKRICIAITEPDAGSDVAHIKTTARKSADGSTYVLNGTKKWITNGKWSDYATVCVRTGGEGAAGLSVMLVPLLNHTGVTMRGMNISGQRSSGTTSIELDNVEVPVENLIGREGDGMKYIMVRSKSQNCQTVSDQLHADQFQSRALDYCGGRNCFCQSCKLSWALQSSFCLTIR